MKKIILMIVFCFVQYPIQAQSDLGWARESMYGKKKENRSENNRHRNNRTYSSDMYKRKEEPSSSSYRIIEDEPLESEKELGSSILGE